MERENMVQDLSMLQEFYEAYAAKIGRIREKLARPLTYAEKILYTHLYDDADLRSFKRGEDYVNFRPNRVAMQDATAQMALLQFMNAGKDRVAVPSTVHCDHLIQAYRGAKVDLPEALTTNKEVYDFLNAIPMDELADLMIVSHVDLVKGEGGVKGLTEGLGMSVAHAAGNKCLRCWKVLPTVGSDAGHPDLCPRCAAVVKNLPVIE